MNCVHPRVIVEHCPSQWIVLDAERRVNTVLVCVFGDWCILRPKVWREQSSPFICEVKFDGAGGGSLRAVVQAEDRFSRSRPPAARQPTHRTS